MYNSLGRRRPSYRVERRGGHAHTQGDQTRPARLLSPEGGRPAPSEKRVPPTSLTLRHHKSDHLVDRMLTILALTGVQQRCPVGLRRNAL